MRENWPNTLVAVFPPRHEGLVEIYVAGVDDFTTSRDPYAVTAGHVGAETEVNPSDAVRVQLGLRVRDAR